MEIVKIKKTDLNLTLEKLLNKFGLVKDNRAYPERLCLSKEDEKILRKNIEQKFKKDFPKLSKKALQTSVGMYWLNLGPSSRLDQAIRPGYAIILNKGE